MPGYRWPITAQLNEYTVPGRPPGKSPSPGSAVILLFFFFFFFFFSLLPFSHSCISSIPHSLPGYFFYPSVSLQSRLALDRLLHFGESTLPPLIDRNPIWPDLA